MCKICVFAGTTEGRELVQALKKARVDTLACTATEYGGTLLEAGESLRVSAQRLTKEDMESLFAKEGFSWVVDATHPYAPIVTENIRAACESTKTPYLRLLRDGGELPEGSLFAASTEEAAELLSKMEGNILLTTGSKEIKKYASIPDFDKRVFARVLSVEDSITACREAGLPASHIIAMQGPFSAELNTAMLKSLDCSILVTKDGGSRGGFPQKAAGAAAAGARLLVIGRPAQVQGLSLRECAEKIGLELRPNVQIVGIGPGGREDMTLRAIHAVRDAQCIIGAKRMLDAVALPGQKRVEAIAPDKIVEAIRENSQFLRFAVVMAGDIGFYSGTKKLLPLLSRCEVSLVPGLSSLVTLCARLGTSYEDVFCTSLHGRQGDLISVLSRHPRVFTLVGGDNGVGKLCQELTAAGLGQVRVSAGQCLGYPEETVTVGTAEELSTMHFHSLSAALLEWQPDTVVTQGLPDSVFLRGTHADGSAVPMTKRDVRACALARLELREDAVCWDIGAGTGSVSIEMAKLCQRGRVYAVEKKEAALALLEENKALLHVPNLEIVPGAAPESCLDLPAPTHVFIGGSSGTLKPLLNLIREKNPKARIVVTAIALETVAELTACRKELGFAQTEVACITAASGREVGSYTLMTGQNPVYIFTFQG